MGNLRKIVGVGLAVALVAALAVYVLLPKAGPTTNSVVVNEPQTPTNPGSGGTTSGGSGSGGSSGGGSGGSNPPPTTPPAGRPPKAHGQNSHGPKHMICLPEKDHPGNGVSQYQGANQYRGQCPAGAAQGSLNHGHGAVTWAVDAVTAESLVYIVPSGGIHGIE